MLSVQMSWRLSLVLRLLCFPLLCFAFRIYAFVEATALRSTVLPYAGAPTATRVSFFLEMSLFPSICFYHFRVLFVWWRVRRTFFPSEWCFLPCAHGLDFWNELMWDFNQSINQNKWRTIDRRRGKGMVESFSRETLRQAPQKEGGEILCDLPPVWPRLVRPQETDVQMTTHTHTLHREKTVMVQKEVGKRNISKEKEWMHSSTECFTGKRSLDRNGLLYD